MLTENKFKKYFLYAIGEIVLVVIGILIALQINNWNEQKNNEEKITNILKEIQSDILIDLETSNKVFDYQILTDSISKNILNNKYTLEDFRNNNFQFIGYNYRDFTTTSNGYDNLTVNLDNVPEKYKHLLPEVKNLYVKLKTTIDVYNEKIRSTVYTNINNLSNFNWYQDFLKNKENKEQIDFFLNDVAYKNLVATYMGYRINIFQISNEYRVKAIDLYLKIHKVINSTIEVPKIVNYKNKSSNNYIGTYTLKETINPSSMWNSNIDVVKKNDQLVIINPIDDFDLKLLSYTKNTFFLDEFYDGIILFDSPKSGHLYISYAVNSYAIYIKTASN